MPKEVMTAEDLAQYLGFSKNWVYRKAETGELPATRLGNRWRFKKSVIDRWLEEGALKRAKPSRRGGRALAAGRGLEGRLASGLNFVKEKGEVRSTDYAAKFKISLATARKDLNELIKRRLIRKLGGGRSTRYGAIR